MPQRILKKTRKLALLEGAAAGTLFGTAAIFISILGARGFVDSFSISFWRLAVACLVLLVGVSVFQRSFNWCVLRKDIGGISFLGVLLGLHFILFVSAVLDTTIINATVLVNTTPIWSMLVSSVLFKLKPSRLAILGIGVSFIGGLIITYGHAVTGTWTIQLKGDLEAVFAAIVEAFYLNYGRKIRQRTPLLPLMLFIYVFSAVTLVAIGIGASSHFALPADLNLVLALIGLGLLPTAFAHSFYFSSLSNLKSFETAAMALLEPVGATLLGVAIFTEVPSPFFVLGAVLVLAGIVAIAVKE